MKLLKKAMKLSKDKRYLLTCSFGPDSMALFCYLLNYGYQFEVAHVNYHILEQADDDEKGIRDFCGKYNIKLHVLQTHMPENVNEEIWAREVRYDYFVKVAKENNIKDVLVAHNLGDDIETYLLQKDRGGVFLHYGLEKKSEREGVNIIRPLLKIPKDELENYCKFNNVPYSIDPSNFDSKFKRNKIRKDLKELNEQEIKSILLEKKEKNLQNLSIIKKFSKLGLPKYFDTTKKLFKEIGLTEFQLILIYLFKKNQVFTPLSEGRCKNLLEVIKFKSGNYKEKIDSNNFLYLDYGVISIHQKGKEYEHTLDSPSSKSINFSINTRAKNFKLLEDEFPITIKPCKDSKAYQFKGVTLKVNREFISWKMPQYIREIWPGIFNKKGELIYVPRYQKKVKKNGLLKFKIKQLLC